MKEILYGNVVCQPVAAKGSLSIVRHIFKNRARDGVVETDLEAREHRLVHLEFGGRLFQGIASLPLGNAPYVAGIIDAGYKGGKRTQKFHKHDVLSFADVVGDQDYAIEQLKDYSRQYVEKFYVGSPAWLIGIHGDKAHPHAHVIVSNWDEQKRDLYNPSPSQLNYRLSLYWYKGTVQPGAYTRIPLGSAKKRKRFRQKAELDVNDLADLIRLDPENYLVALVKDGTLVPYVTASGNPGYIFRGRRITKDAINYALQPPTRTHAVPSYLRRATKYDACIAAKTPAEYAAMGDFPPYALHWAERQKIIESSFMPTNPLFQRNARSAIYSKLRFKGQYAGPIDPALKPLLDIFDALLDGKIRLPKTKPDTGTLFGFIWEAITTMAPQMKVLEIWGKSVLPLLEAININAAPSITAIDT
jgi:hypothetical protein